VRLASGDAPADIVVSNADVAGPIRSCSARSRAGAGPTASSARARYSMSLFVWYFGTNRATTTSTTTRSCWARATRACCDDIFTRKVLADDFSLYLHRPTATDPSLAPPGCDAFYVLSPVPHLGSGTDWRRAPNPIARDPEAAGGDVLPGLGEPSSPRG
jgi:phytoene desaturase